MKNSEYPQLMQYDFSTIKSFVYNRYGIVLTNEHYAAVSHFINSRLANFSFIIQKYLAFLEKNREEECLFIDAITVCETYFFREEKHFKILEEHVFPYLESLEKKSIVIWSAACSTGEEAISLSTLAHFCLEEKEFSYKVYATDLNERALECFKSGIFTQNSFRSDGESYRFLLNPFLQKHHSHWKLRDEIWRTLYVHPCNLLKDTYSFFPCGFDIVFFRNTMIYFNCETRHKILNKIVDKMNDGAFLFFSSSEVPMVFHPSLKVMEYEGGYFFQKREMEKEKKVQIKKKQIEFDRIRLINTSLSDNKPSKKVDFNDLIDHIVFKKVDWGDQKYNESVFQAMESLKKILKWIDLLSVQNSRFELYDFSRMVKENEIIFHLYGMISMVDNDEGKAMEYFQKALEYNQECWPASFYKAMLMLEKDSIESLHAFKICAEMLRRYIAKGSDKYIFLLAGFDSKYFLDVCEKWINKLTK